MKCITYTDGGARGNPGPAAGGIVIKDESGKNLSSFGVFLGVQTNNFAEYTALLTALQKAAELGATEVDCILDSELIVKQMQGLYKVKEPTLQKLFVKVYNAAQKFKKVTYRHVPRAQNKEADAEVNKVLDEAEKNIPR